MKGIYTKDELIVLLAKYRMETRKAKSFDCYLSHAKRFLECGGGLL